MDKVEFDTLMNNIGHELKKNSLCITQLCIKCVNVQSSNAS